MFSPHALPTVSRLAAIALRVALALSFLSAVADRFGLWGPPGTPNVFWGTMPAFLAYTAQTLSFLPPSLAPLLGWTATILEIVLAVGLLIGYRLRWFAIGSAALLASFAVAMTISFGPEQPLSFSVWTAAAAALLLGCVDESPAPSPP